MDLTCRKLLDIIRAQEQSKGLDEQFHHQLEQAQDGFSVIADYYGRGVFNKVLITHYRAFCVSLLLEWMQIKQYV